MGLFDTVRRAIAGKQYGDIDQEQSEALIDTLTYTMVAEGEVPDDERRELKRTLEEIDWRGSDDLDTYVEQSFEKARRLDASAEGEQAFLRALADRLGQQKLQEEAYFLAARVAAVDADLAQEETEVLSSLVEIFDIPRERLKLLTRELRHQL